MPIECETAVNRIRDIINLEGAQNLAEELSITFNTINQISQYDDIKHCSDPGVVQAVQKVHKAVQIAFVHSRAYVSKAHSLAEYICDEKPYTIESVQEGKYQDFKDYLEMVLERSQNCQKDIAALIDFINKDSKNVVEEQKAVVTQIQDGAQQRETSDSLKAGAAFVGFVGSSIVTGGAAVTGACSTKLFAPAGLATSFGASVVAVVSITAAIGFVIIAVKKYFDSRRGAQIVAHCERAQEAIENLGKGLKKIEESLNKVNAGLKTEIDNNYSSIKIDEEKFKRCSGPVLRSLIRTIEAVSEGAKRVKEYCQPLTETEDMNDFIQKVTRAH